MSQKEAHRSVAFVISQVGYHWEELQGAYSEFKRADWRIDFFTVDGETPQPDPNSLRYTHLLFRSFGFGISRRIGPESEMGKEITAKLANVRPVSAIDARDFDAIYLPGGHGALFDMTQNPKLHRVLEAMHRERKVLSGVCHATSAFAYALDSDGQSIIKGKRLTGFADPLDRWLLIPLKKVDSRFLPIPHSNDEAIRNAGGNVNVVAETLNPRHTRIDAPFVTGTGPKAAARVARGVIALANAAGTK